MAETRQPSPSKDGGRRVVASTFVTLDGYATGFNRQDFELAHIKPYANGVVAMSYSRKAVA